MGGHVAVDKEVQGAQRLPETVAMDDVTGPFGLWYNASVDGLGRC
jgi:hypothetical protein